MLNGQKSQADMMRIENPEEIDQEMIEGKINLNLR